MKAPAAWFIKEPGKTKQFSLESPAAAETLKKLESAEILNFKTKDRHLFVTDSKGENLGAVADGDLAEKLLFLLKEKKKLTPVLIAREKKKLAILIVAEESLFRDESGEK